MFGNPYQIQMDSLLQQKQAIEKKMNELQQYGAVPPININNQITPVPNNFDFNGKWVNSEQEARNIARNNLPVMSMDRNLDCFYLTNPDGSFEIYDYVKREQVPQANDSERITKLENKLNELISALTQPKEEQKSKGGKADEQPTK